MTANQLTANVVTNLRFYRRSRLLVLVGIFTAIVFLISMATTAFTMSKKFNTIQAFVEGAEWFLILLAALLGLITISHHVRNRSLKLVVTHPCSVEVWVLSHFVSAFTMIATLFAIVAAVTSILFVVWGIPIQWGYLYVIAWALCSAMITFAFLLLLSNLVHPIVAALIAMVFGPNTFRWLLTLLESQIEYGPEGFLRTVNVGLKLLLSAVYYGLPAYGPFADRLAVLASSYRVGAGDTYALFVTVVYTATFCGLMFLLTSAVLKRKRQI
jgi:ABC-type transport system involved in multi-copper enzyme maturation permease subunit